MNVVTMSNDKLSEFWQEAVETLTAQKQKEVNEKAARLNEARQRMSDAVPAEVLEALGLDVSTATWPAQYDGAVAVGLCVFQGEQIETKVTASLRGYNGSVGLYVGDKVVVIDDQVRARVGLALGQAAQEKRQEAKRKAESLLNAARSWSLTYSDLQNGNLRWDKMPDVAPAAIQEARRIVAERKWEEKRKQWERVRRVRAEHVAQEGRAVALLEACAEWNEKERLYQAQCATWASNWTAKLACRYGRPTLWRVTYAPTALGVVTDDEEWLQKTVIIETPEDLAAHRTLVPVTEVSPDGRVTEGVRLGAIVKMEPVTWGEWPRIDAALPYFRTVRAGRFFVNVPPESLMEKPEENRPVWAHGLMNEWLSERGFGVAANKMEWRDLSAGEVATMTVGELITEGFLQ